MKRFVVSSLLICLTCLSAGPSLAQGIVDVAVSGSAVEAEIEFASGIGAELSITFEQVVGLYETARELGLSASLVDATDLELVDRLPDAQLVSIPAAFPVLIEIEPLPDEPLTFTGLVSIVLYTHDLTYTPNSPLRLFAADAGGPFIDITNSIGMGSYRVGGSKGGFSQFLIVSDLRAASTVIEEKFGFLQSTLDANAAEIDDDVLAVLQGHLDAAWSWYGAGDLISAKKEIDDFSGAVQAHSGAAIPAIWRSARDLVNVAGELRQGAATLRFSLSLAASS